MASWTDDTGYELRDPKHPTFHERYAEAADYQRKAEKEEVTVSPVVKAWDEYQAAAASNPFSDETKRKHSAYKRALTVARKTKRQSQ